MYVFFASLAIDISCFFTVLVNWSCFRCSDLEGARLTNLTEIYADTGVDGAQRGRAVRCGVPVWRAIIMSSDLVSGIPCTH